MKYFKHVTYIPKGEYGKFSKVEEEFCELKDAYTQEKGIFQLVESADLLYSLECYSLIKFKIPLILLLLLSYIRIPYKLGKGVILLIYRKHYDRVEYAHPRNRVIKNIVEVEE